ncbi:MAG: hypothetical protein Q4D51_07200 [Eubacteriales bacterium]|nr:hypothetical protein [Eubacteriales bacterium]
MKKRLMLASMMVIAMVLVGCGNKGTEEHIKTGEQIAVEQAAKAEEVVDQNNEAVKNLQQETDAIDEAE